MSNQKDTNDRTPPEFRDGEVEVRLYSGEVFVLTTVTGLIRVREQIDRLLADERLSHIHAEDVLSGERSLLTSRSLKLVFSKFPDA